MNEVWRDHPVYRLQVSNLGRVMGPRRVRVPRLDRYGYLRLNFYHEGAIKTELVHRLVADCWVGVRDGMTVNHKNLCKTDNRAENLEVISAAENVRHAFQSGAFVASGVCIPSLGFYSRREAERQTGVPRRRQKAA